MSPPQCVLGDRVRLRDRFSLGRLLHQLLMRGAKPHHLLLAVAAAMCFALKWFYQHAGPDDLRWILGPTSALTGWWTDHNFVYEPGFGYVSFNERFVIAPECSGINFLVILFASLTGSAWLYSKLDGRRFWLAALVSLSTTVLVNAVRISISLARPSIWSLDASDAHRVLGILVFCSALLLVHLFWTSWGLRTRRSTLPFGTAIYLLVTLGVPMVRRTTGPAFVHHFSWTLALSVTLLVLVVAVRNVVRRKHASCGASDLCSSVHALAGLRRVNKGVAIDATSASASRV